MARFKFILVAVLLASAMPLTFARAESAIGIHAIEKIAVFPLFYSGERGAKVDEVTAKAFDEAWWQVREELAGTGRFVLASRTFLQKADAFQPRGELTAADAVILGRYVEADALMTLAIYDRNLTVSVWDSSDGSVSWAQTVELHPSVLIREQVPKIARALTKEFIAAIPYHGSSLIDSFTRTAVYEDGSAKKVRVKVGKSADVAVGDPVEWVVLTRSNLEPLFEGGGKVEVKAEGRITGIKDQVLTVEVTRARGNDLPREGSLLVITKEAKRLNLLAGKKDLAIAAAVATTLGNEDPKKGAVIEPEAFGEERQRSDTKPIATTLSILGSIAIILLLAF